jgi:hypothetical protein
VLATLVPVARLFELWDGAASDMGRRAIELLGDDPPPELEATACVNLASDLVLVDQHGEAAEWTERGLAAARRAGRKDLESLCLMYQATSKGWLGDPDGETDLREAIERAEALGPGTTPPGAAATWSACCSARPAWRRCRPGSIGR